MFDWPIVAPLLTIAFGTTVLLINRLLGNEQDKRTQWKVVFFVFAAATFQITFLGGKNWGTTSSGLFYLDGFNAHLVTAAVVYFLFSHVSFSLEVREHDFELGVFQTIFALVSISTILTNNLVLLPLSFATMFFISAIAPLLTEEASKNNGIKFASAGAVVVMIFSGFAIALIAEAADSFMLDQIRSGVLETTKHPQFYIGFALLIFLLFLFLLFPPSALFVDRYTRSATWSLVAFFRQSLQLVAALLIIRLSFFIAMKPNDVGQFVSNMSFSYEHVIGGMICLFLFVAVVTLLLAKNVLVIFQTMTGVIALISLISINLGSRQGIYYAQANVYGFIFVAIGLFCLLSFLNLSTNSSLEDLRIAIQKTPVAVQLSFLATLILSVPIFNFYGFDLLTTMMIEAKKRSATGSTLVILMIICLVLISLILSLRIIELFHGNAKRNGQWDTRSLPNKLWCYVLILCLLFLGIYPTPLYKYLSHSVDLFINNS